MARRCQQHGQAWHKGLSAGVQYSHEHDLDCVTVFSGTSAVQSGFAQRASADLIQPSAPSERTSPSSMIDKQVVSQLWAHLHSGDDERQVFAAAHIRDLCEEREEYRLEFGQVGVVQPLVGLLEDQRKQSTLTAAQALTALAQNETVRNAIREAGGITNLVGVLQQGINDVGADIVTAVVTTLLALTLDDSNQESVATAGGLPCIVKLLAGTSEEVTELAARLIGRLAYHDHNKDALRDAGAIVALLKLLRGNKTPAGLQEPVAQALTILAVNNEVNQDFIRDQYGIAPLVKLLEATPYTAITLAAADAVRACAMNNDGNKTAVRENWGIPLLVRMLSAEEGSPAVEKAVDCLRILTTGNEANKIALFTIPAAVPALVKLMSPTQPDAIVTERAAAVIGNLSLSTEYFTAIREAGALQRLVSLLDCGPKSRITEIAAKTLANMAVNDSNRTGIRLAGGIPPLMRLLLERPTEQVLLAADEALRRLQVTDAERNAILDTFRYVEAHALAVPRAYAGADSSAAPVGASVPLALANGNADAAAPKPFTRYAPAEVCALLTDVGIRDTGPFEENGVNGGDLLELTEDELRTDLGLSPLQVKKLRRVQEAFEVFNSMMHTQGRAELTIVELREWLISLGRSESDADAIVSGFRESLRKPSLAFLTFVDFARGYQWLLRTLAFMQQAADHGFSMARLPSFRSLQSGEITPSDLVRAASSNRDGLLGDRLSDARSVISE